MKLISNVLDQQIVDSEGRKFGKVDGLVLEWSGDGPPRVAYLELGGPVLARRLGRRCERWALRANRFFGIRREPRYRIPWEKVLDIGIDVSVEIDGADEPPLDWERWLRDRVISKLPFA
jgi:sporulation protein YlmC with PRC-barrel domain